MLRLVRGVRNLHDQNCVGVREKDRRWRLRTDVASRMGPLTAAQSSSLAEAVSLPAVVGSPKARKGAGLGEVTLSLRLTVSVSGRYPFRFLTNAFATVGGRSTLGGMLYRVLCVAVARGLARGWVTG